MVKPLLAERHSGLIEHEKLLGRLWKPGDCPPDGSRPWVHASHNAVVPYVREFLTAPHPYRPGAMCPYVPRALRSGSIYLTAGIPDVPPSKLLKTTRSAIETFLKARDPGNVSALIVLFPDGHPLEGLLHIHRDLKIWCVQRNLMVGVLSPQSDAWSIHSRDFFPLRTPIPTLVVRDMAPFDTQFLIDGPYNLHHRISFLSAYLQRFEHSPHSNRPEVEYARSLYRRYIRVQLARRIGYGAGLLVLSWMARRCRATQAMSERTAR